MGTDGLASGRVLIVEDDDAIRTLVRDLLVEAGYAVDEARGGHDGLAHVASARPDLIVLDRLMPEGDGTEFARRYRELPGPHAPIVALCATHDAPDWAQSIGAVGYVPKPFEIEDLLATIATHVGKRG